MNETSHINTKLVHMAFLQREEGFHHHAYHDEMQHYELLREGDMRSVELGLRLYNGTDTGVVSKDKLRNKRYLFVASVTLATRFAIEGGLDAETAYNLSDIFILRMDDCRTIAEITELYAEMLAEFTRRVRAAKNKRVYSKAVLQAMDYVYKHLQDVITVDAIAEDVKLSRSYLSLLFKREVGVSVSDYIRSKRVEAAKNMLKHSDFTLQEISSYLSFNTQSHFTSVFKKETGLTPSAYRHEYFGRSFDINE